VTQRRECEAEGCTNDATVEAIVCRRHWDLVPGQLKAYYRDARWMVLKAIKAKEMK
jgi:hypothetical protein